MFFSKETCGFYSTDIHGSNMPADVVEITHERWVELLDGQVAGLHITSDENGYPVLTQQPALPLEQQAEDARRLRNGLLFDSDWTQLPDTPQTLKDLWSPYRQALRDVPQQPGFPYSITWPEKP